jgi:tetratricopeptide (TPR) repeat protein
MSRYWRLLTVILGVGAVLFQVSKYEAGNFQDTIADLDQAIRINPNFAEAYYKRGVARYRLGDNQGALTDYEQAIRVNPNDAAAYHNRGVARSELGDKRGAISDIQKVADLFKSAGQQESYDKAMELLQKVSAP